MIMMVLVVLYSYCSIYDMFSLGLVSKLLILRDFIIE